jgi:16S rRNA (uracil1498-N3)-methyltransferase
MRRFFGRIDKNLAFVEDEEYVHLRTVLRARIGDELIIYDGSEKEYYCKINALNKNYAVCDVVDIQKCKGLPQKNIVLFQALTKKDKMELILQKTVELGVSELIPFESEYCTVKTSENKKERMEKVVISACKQCERSVPMNIGDCIGFSELINSLNNFAKMEKSIILFANERQGKEFDFTCLKDYQNIAVVVGAEGGFSQKEKTMLCEISESVGLGKRILRSETATIVLCGMVSILGEN